MRAGNGFRSMLPAMNVEAREGKSHGLIAPDARGSEGHTEQLFDMHILVAGARSDTPWQAEAVNVLGKYAPFPLADIPSALRRFGFSSWAQCVEFVKDDLCVDFGRLVLKYAAEENLTSTFIHSNVTFFARLMDRMERTLHKAFDEKYYHKHPRPLSVMIEDHGENAACLVNYTHPGHWAYPAGHGAKFFETVDLARDFWTLNPRQDQEILTCSYVLAMARSGGGVHYPKDNIASGVLAGLPEFKSYKA